MSMDSLGCEDFIALIFIETIHWKEALTQDKSFFTMHHLLISVDSVSAVVPLSYGGKSPRVGTDHSRMDETDLHTQVKATRCKLFLSAVTVKFQLRRRL